MKRLAPYAMLVALFSCLPVQAAVQKAPEAISLAGPMVADISQSTIQIHSSFNGAELLVFGSRNVRGDLVIAVRGPHVNSILQRKERIAGMWMHVERHKYYNLPLFYALASTRPLKQIAQPYILRQLGLGEKYVVSRSSDRSLPDFDNALRDIMARKHRWQEPFGSITYFGESLFKARLKLPSNLPRGDYSIEVYLFDEGKPIAFQTVPLRAFKTGMDAWIYDEAQHDPWMYGILAIIMALCGGSLAHRLFHKN